MTLTDIEKKVARLSVIKEADEKRLKTVNTDLSTASRDFQEYTEATDLLIKIGTSHRNLALSKIESLLTTSLQAVFDHPYTCSLTAEEKRGQIELSLSVKDNGLELDPATQMGGGVVDILSLSLRVVLWSMAKKRTDHLIILDEPVRMVSESYVANVAQMIKKLSDSLGIQFVIVTHREALTYASDRTFRVTKTDGTSSIMMER